MIVLKRLRRHGLAAGLLLAACGGGGPRPQPPAPLSLEDAAVDSAWNAAVALFRVGDWTQAQRAFEFVSNQLGATDPRLVRARYFVAEILLTRREHLQAVRMFRRVADESRGAGGVGDSLAPTALVRAGDAYAALWRRPELDPTYGETALTVYREVLDRFPGTPAARTANVRIQELQEKFAWKEWKNAQFYLRFKAYDSAILTLRNLVSEYPRSAVAPVALVRLVATYRTLGYEEDQRETCAYIQRFHPGAPGLARVCPAVAADTARAP